MFMPGLRLGFETAGSHQHHNNEAHQDVETEVEGLSLHKGSIARGQHLYKKV